MVNRLQQLVRSEVGGKFLVPFFTAGFPSEGATLKLVDVAVSSGANIIELGMPFSDPLADGPEIQFSSHAALAGGISLKRILRLVDRIRRKHDIPLVLMGYFNPILAYSESRFARDAFSAGVDGFIIPDLCPEEAGDFREVCAENNLSMVFLVSPTTSEKRLKMIDRVSTGLLYAVTVTGVTGTGKVFDKSTDNYLSKLRQNLSSKFVAGFGVTSPETAKRLARYADGVVIGSALIKALREASGTGSGVQKVGKLLQAIRDSI